MTEQQIENGARTLYERDERMNYDEHLRVLWAAASEEKREAYREDFLAALEFIRTQTLAEFKLSGGLFTLAEDELDAFLLPQALRV